MTKFQQLLLSLLELDKKVTINIEKDIDELLSQGIIKRINNDFYLRTTSNDEKFYETFRNIWPKNVKTGNRLVRGDKNEVKRKLINFKKEYHYDETTILAAAKKYIGSFVVNTKGMICADYFIHKRGSGSQLAAYCEEIEDSYINHNIFDDEYTDL